MVLSSHKLVWIPKFPFACLMKRLWEIVKQRRGPLEALGERERLVNEYVGDSWNPHQPLSDRGPAIASSFGAICGTWRAVGTSQPLTLQA